MLTSAAGVFGRVDFAAPLVVAAAIVGVGVLIALFAVPPHLLPAMAFLVMVVMPDRLLFLAPLEYFPPEVIIMFVWAVRKLLNVSTGRRTAVRTPVRASVIVLLMAALIWFIVVAISNTPARSASWMVAFLVLLVFPLLLPDREREVDTLRRLWPWTGAVISIYACVQAVIQTNPIYDPLYNNLRLVPIQHWSVFRADATLAHPLTAGLFFAMTLAFCVGRWVETSRRSFAALALLNGLGVIATVSRGSYIAAGVAVAAVLLLALIAGQRFGRARIIAILGAFSVFGYFALQSDSFQERSNSVDGLGSATAREDMWGITEAAASSYNWLGAGPGTSETAAIPFNWKGLPIENSYFQLLISVGVPGLILFSLFLLSVYRVAIRERNLSAIGGLTAALVAIGGYAAIDGPRTALGLLAFMILLTVSPIRANTDPDKPPQVSARKGHRPLPTLRPVVR